LLDRAIHTVIDETSQSMYMLYMLITKNLAILMQIFKSGQSHAVRIPKALNFDSGRQNVEIERKHDTGDFSCWKNLPQL